MNRTNFYKTLYVLLIALLGGIGIWIYLKSEKNLLILITLVVVFLVPGRICGVVWRDFFRGRNLMTQKRFKDAIPFFESFLTKVRERPWIKKLMLFSWGMYTRDIEAMTLNNLGAINIELGHFEKAEDFLKEAIDLDPKTPLPYFNLALVAEANGNREEAMNLLKESKKRGFNESSVDLLIRRVSEILAKIEGKVNTEQSSGGDA